MNDYLRLITDEVFRCQFFLLLELFGESFVHLGLKQIIEDLAIFDFVVLVIVRIVNDLH